jgi:hypothetical protein
MRKVKTAVIMVGKARHMPTSEYTSAGFKIELNDHGVLFVEDINQASNYCGRKFAITGDMQIEFEDDDKPEAKRR